MFKSQVLENDNFFLNEEKKEGSNKKLFPGRILTLVTLEMVMCGGGRAGQAEVIPCLIMLGKKCFLQTLARFSLVSCIVHGGNNAEKIEDCRANYGKHVTY